MKRESNSWSEGLQQQTLEAISEVRISCDGKLHFKNHDSRGAFMTWQDLMGGKLRLTDKVNEQVSEFANTDELLAAGWAID